MGVVKEHKREDSATEEGDAKEGVGSPFESLGPPRARTTLVLDPLPSYGYSVTYFAASISTR